MVVPRRREPGAVGRFAGLSREQLPERADQVREPGRVHRDPVPLGLDLVPALPEPRVVALALAGVGDQRLGRSEDEFANAGQVGGAREPDEPRVGCRGVRECAHRRECRRRDGLAGDERVAVRVPCWDLPVQRRDNWCRSCELDACDVVRSGAVRQQRHLRPVPRDDGGEHEILDERGAEADVLLAQVRVSGSPSSGPGRHRGRCGSCQPGTARVARCADSARGSPQRRDGTSRSAAASSTRARMRARRLPRALPGRRRDTRAHPTRPQAPHRARARSAKERPPRQRHLHVSPSGGRGAHAAASAATTA